MLRSFCSARAAGLKDPPFRLFLPDVGDESRAASRHKIRSLRFHETPRRMVALAFESAKRLLYRALVGLGEHTPTRLIEKFPPERRMIRKSTGIVLPRCRLNPP